MMMIEKDNRMRRDKKREYLHLIDKCLQYCLRKKYGDAQKINDSMKELRQISITQQTVQKNNERELVVDVWIKLNGVIRQLMKSDQCRAKNKKLERQLSKAEKKINSIKDRSTNDKPSSPSLMQQLIGGNYKQAIAKSKQTSNEGLADIIKELEQYRLIREVFAKNNKDQLGKGGLDMMDMSGQCKAIIHRFLSLENQNQQMLNQLKQQVSYFKQPQQKQRQLQYIGLLDDQIKEFIREIHQKAIYYQSECANMQKRMGLLNSKIIKYLLKENSFHFDVLEENVDVMIMLLKLHPKGESTKVRQQQHQMMLKQIEKYYKLKENLNQIIAGNQSNEEGGRDIEDDMLIQDLNCILSVYKDKIKESKNLFQQIHHIQMQVNSMLKCMQNGREGQQQQQGSYGVMDCLQMMKERIQLMMEESQRYKMHEEVINMQHKQLQLQMKQLQSQFNAKLQEMQNDYESDLNLKRIMYEEEILHLKSKLQSQSCSFKLEQIQVLEGKDRIDQ